jgi:hypothetical protein
LRSNTVAGANVTGAVVFGSAASETVVSLQRRVAILRASFKAVHAPELVQLKCQRMS